MTFNREAACSLLALLALLALLGKTQAFSPAAFGSAKLFNKKGAEVAVHARAPQRARSAVGEVVARTLTCRVQVPADTLKGASVALYFAGEWCPMVSVFFFVGARFFVGLLVQVRLLQYLHSVFRGALFSCVSACCVRGWRTVHKLYAKAQGVLCSARRLQQDWCSKGENRVREVLNHPCNNNILLHICSSFNTRVLASQIFASPSAASLRAQERLAVSKYAQNAFMSALFRLCIIDPFTPSCTRAQFRLEQKPKL